MKALIEIILEDLVAENTNLYFELSEKSIAYFFKDKESNEIKGFSVYHSSKKEIADAFQEVLEANTTLKKNYNKTVFSFSLDECLLMPAEYYNAGNNRQALELMYGDVEEGIILTDEIKEKKIYSVYRIPETLHKIVAGHFPDAIFIHQYTVLLKTDLERDLLKVIFYSNKIVVHLFQNGKTKIIQSYTYKTAEDVVYHLLNITQQFNATGMEVRLYGMIEKESALFNELYKYFLNIDFDMQSIPGFSINMAGEYPLHYFSYLFSIASCV